MQQGTSSTPIHILFIGNSYTSYYKLPSLVVKIAASSHDRKQVETDMITAGGASLRQHWNKGEALEAIRQRSWNYVVLQEQSTLPIKSPKRFHDSARLFHEEIMKQGAQTVFYLTWARQHAPETQASLTEAYTNIAKELQALVAPVGVAWQTALRENPVLVLHEEDGSHPTPAGSYLAACVFYATLFNDSPVGLAVPENLKLIEADATILQRVAWQTVQDMLSVP
jgi:hypothetical protein